ncbi:hypothetical protein [Zhongshania aliphaticivorans]|uniref:hypothetical protein n=1 Tax=Zhongshania aliphaticivorans TaxID=1470434 RepID=UPI0012E58639|nr:hypothetical protein [Zhongshania aliphaticivorans]CAA0103374.1 Uncharacterised protein [Zhongshania aliphaticivorans]
MLRIVGAVLGNSTAVAILLAIGAVLYHGWRTGSLQDLLQAKDQKVGSLIAERDHWRDAALAYQSRADKQESLREAANESVRNLQKVLAERERSYTLQQQTISDSPPRDDGPVAPVLRNAIEGLP